MIPNITQFKDLQYEDVLFSVFVLNVLGPHNCQLLVSLSFICKAAIIKDILMVTWPSDFWYLYMYLMISEPLYPLHLTIPLKTRTPNYATEIEKCTLIYKTSLSKIPALVCSKCFVFLTIWPRSPITVLHAYHIRFDHIWWKLSHF